MDRTYIFEDGAYLRKAGNHLAVTKGDKIIAEIPISGHSTPSTTVALLWPATWSRSGGLFSGTG